jgi:hypothetical protein
LTPFQPFPQCRSSARHIGCHVINCQNRRFTQIYGFRRLQLAKSSVWNSQITTNGIGAIHVIYGISVSSGQTMNDKEYKHSSITHTIIGAAMKVHSTLGNGFQEVIYQRALAIELAKQGLSFQRELEMKIYYD